VGGATCGHVFAQGIAQTTQSGHMHAAMGQLNVCQSGRTRLAPLQSHVHTTDQEPVFNGPQTLGALRVAPAHLVFPASRVCEIACRAHGLVFQNAATQKAALLF
jgi:hypothetical protein